MSGVLSSNAITKDYETLLLLVPAMSIAVKQLLVVVITFLFLLLQLGIRKASVKPSVPLKIKGVQESMEHIRPHSLVKLQDHPRFQYPPTITKRTESKIKSKSSPKRLLLLIKSTKNKTHSLELTKQKIRNDVSMAKSRMESTRVEYVKVCKSLRYQKTFSPVKYRSYAFGRLQWCSVPKSGTTFLVRDLRPTLREMDDGGDVDETPKRFIVVREPYSRLVSAFFSKIVGHPGWWFSFGTKIIARFRPGMTSKSLRCGHDVTFKEFIKFFIYSVENAKFKNDHFLPIHKVCDMCEDPPDFIAKIETLESDMKVVLNSVNVSGDTGKSFIEVQHLAQLFLSFKSKFEGCAPVCYLLGRFWWGQQATGLIANDTPLPVKGQACDQVSGDQLAKLAWEAHQASMERIADKRRQKMNTSIELWREVSLEDRKKVRDILTLDCRLFGYDCSPDFVFPKEENTHSLN